MFVRAIIDEGVRHLNANPEQLRVVPLGVEERFFQRLTPQALADLREQYRLSGEYILFLGERRPHKNLPGLLKAFTRLQEIDPRPDRQLVIAGDAYTGYREPEDLAESPHIIPFSAGDTGVFIHAVRLF